MTYRLHCDACNTVIPDNCRGPFTVSCREPHPKLDAPDGVSFDLCSAKCLAQWSAGLYLTEPDPQTQQAGE